MYGGGKMVPLSKRVFDKHDTDSSGSISPDEFKSLCISMGYRLTDTEHTFAVKTLDVNGDGEIAYDEFKQWWSTDDRFGKLQLSEEELKTLEVATNYFKHFDQDNSGVIDRDEFTALHADLVKNSLTAHPLEKCLEDLDQDGEGNISFNEYVDWLIRIGSLKVKVM